ncbi:flavin reductase like domain-containing protein [Aspergillus karnatakaensis]|uniref:flavin reductase family protein n=1 Tax=Aspergillus karnatakaensis TaxID=1810916 RepID=UPI003CCCDD20
MKLLRSRALLYARGVRSYRPTGEPFVSRRPYQWTYNRPLTTNTLPASPSPSQPSQSPKDHQNGSESLSTQVRLLMRRVPYPVAIITSTDPTPTPTSTSPTHSSRFRGMTVSSFNTVTLTPYPIISFNVRRPSETLNALLHSGRFLVHLLSPEKNAAALARDFAKGNWSRVSEDGFAADVAGGGFEFVPYNPGQLLSGAGSIQVGEVKGGGNGNKGDTSNNFPLPLLRKKSAGDSDTASIPFVLECRLLSESVVDVYDHSIVVGRAVRAITDPNSDHNSAGIPSATDSEELCLTYANTKFWKIGEGL